jgi:hypothetical protein
LYILKAISFLNTHARTAYLAGKKVQNISLKSKQKIQPIPHKESHPIIRFLDSKLKNVTAE